jgi:hypothetical protein
VRSRGAILLASAVVVVLVASAWVVPASSFRQIAGSADDISTVVTGVVVRADSVVVAPGQTLDRRARPADRHRGLPAVVVALPLLMALAVMWRRPTPIEGRVPERDRGRAVASRAPPHPAQLPALI